MDHPNHYEVLEISANAAAKQVKAAYRRLARQHHPDLNPKNLTAAEKFKQINQAYQILSDPTQRSLYDYDLNNSPGKTSQRSVANSDKAKDYYKQGLKKSQSTNYKEAIQSYTQAVELDPNYANAYNKRGLCYYKLGEFSEAIKDFTKAVYVSPKLAEAYYNRAMARFKLGYTQAAINDYNQALEFKPNYAQAYYRRGLIFTNLKDKQAAIADFQKAAHLFSQQEDLVNYQLVVEEIIKQGGNSSSLIGDICSALFAVTFDPMRMMSVFSQISRRSHSNAIYTGIVLALIFDLCFAVGIFITLQKASFVDEAVIYRLMFVGIITYLSLTISSFIARNILRGKGSWAGDLFIAGVALLPVGYLSITLGFLFILESINIPAALIFSVFSFSYMMLTVYSGCNQISKVSPSASALAVPIILIMTSMPIIIVLPLLISKAQLFPSP